MNPETTAATGLGLPLTAAEQNSASAAGGIWVHEISEPTRVAGMRADGSALSELTAPPRVSAIAAKC